MTMESVISLPQIKIAEKPGREYIPEPYKNKTIRDWSAYHQSQVSEKPYFLAILNSVVDSLSIKTYGGGNGRPPMALSDMIKSCIIKVYEGRSSRRSISDIDIAFLLRYVSRKPHFNTLLKYMNSPYLTKFLENLVALTSAPLAPFEKDFAADSSGISSSFKDNWVQVRLDFQNHHKFMKLHTICGVRTNVIAGVKVTEGKAADSPQFKELLHQAFKNFKIREVSADAGYLSRENVQAVEDIGAKPFIMPRKGVTARAHGSLAWHRMIRMFDNKETLFLKKYHKRSNVEATFSMIKKKVSFFVRSKHDVAQKNEILCIVICHNICCLIQAVFSLGLKLDYLQ